MCLLCENAPSYTLGGWDLFCVCRTSVKTFIKEKKSPFLPVLAAWSGQSLTPSEPGFAHTASGALRMLSKQVLLSVTQQTGAVPVAAAGAQATPAPGPWAALRFAFTSRSSRHTWSCPIAPSLPTITKSCSGHTPNTFTWSLSLRPGSILAFSPGALPGLPA